MTEEERAVSKERRRVYMQEYMREYRKTNKERVMQHHRTYRETHREKVIASRRARAAQARADKQAAKEQQ